MQEVRATAKATMPTPSDQPKETVDRTVHPRSDEATGRPTKRHRQPGMIENMHGAVTASRPASVTLRYHTMPAKDASLVSHGGVVSLRDRPPTAKDAKFPAKDARDRPRCKERGPTRTPQFANSQPTGDGGTKTDMPLFAKLLLATGESLTTPSVALRKLNNQILTRGLQLHSHPTRYPPSYLRYPHCYPHQTASCR